MAAVRSSFFDAGKALLEALRPGGAVPLAPRQWRAVVNLAERHSVAPLLHRRLQADGLLERIPDELAARLAWARRATALDNMRNFGEFRRIAGALGAAAIPAIALKGLHLAELVYRDVSLRPMADLDILVPAAEFHRSLDVLRKAGFSHNAAVVASETAMPDPYEVVLTAPGHEAPLDLHRALDIRRGPVDSAMEAWRCARQAKIADVDAQVLAPEFLLAYVSAHLACIDVFAIRLGALCDVAEIARVHPDIDWQAVADHAARCGWSRGVAVTLRLARDWLEAPVPGQLPAGLDGREIAPSMLDDAMAQMMAMATLPPGLPFAPRLLGLATEAPLRDKLATLGQRVFIPLDELSVRYDRPRASLTLPLFYAARICELFRRYSSSALAMIRDRRSPAEFAARHVRLQRWIAEG